MRNVTVSLLAVSAMFTAAAVIPASAAGEAKEFRANFQTADANADKKLTAEEFAAFIKLNAKDGIGYAPTIDTLGVYEQAFKKVDANEDGSADREEILKAVVNVIAPSSSDDVQKFTANFQTADINADQKLEPAEFAALIKLNAKDKIGHAPAIDYLGVYEQAFKKVDANGDGAADREEILKAVVKM